jgi:hypothetical protein
MIATAMVTLTTLVLTVATVAVHGDRPPVSARHPQLPSGRHCDANGTVRLIERTMLWAGYVRLVFDELRLAGPPRRRWLAGCGPR